MKKLEKATSVLLIGVLISSAVVGTHAVGAQSINDQIKALEAQRAQDQGSANQLEGEAKDIQGQITNLQNQIASIQANIDTNTTRQAELNRQITSAQTKLTEQKEFLSSNIRSMYIEGDISPLEMIASSKNLSDFVDKQEYRDRIKDSISDTMDEVQKLKQQLDDQSKEVTRIIAEQSILRGSLSKKENEAADKLAQTNQQKSTFDEAVKNKSGEISKLRAQQLAANRSSSGGGGGQIISAGRSGGGYPDKWAFAAMDSLVDTWGLYNRECVSYTAWKVYQSGKRMPYFGGRGNAKEWPSTAQSFGIQTSSTPRAQSVAISYGGPYGHSMWVEEVLGGGKIRVSEYNYYVDGTYTERVISSAGLTYVYF